MKIPPSITNTFTHLRFRSHRIDVIRDPYKIWFLLCTGFVIFFIVVVALDVFISYQQQTGQLVATTAPSQTPTPIIDENVLTTTAQAYGAKAAALAALAAGGSTNSPVIDPSL